MKPISCSAQIRLTFGTYHDLHKEDTEMLAPLVIDLLIGCGVLLFAGWVKDILHASTKI